MNKIFLSLAFITIPAMSMNKDEYKEFFEMQQFCKVELPKRIREHQKMRRFYFPPDGDIYYLRHEVGMREGNKISKDIEKCKKWGLWKELED